MRERAGFTRLNPQQPRWRDVCFSFSVLNQMTGMDKKRLRELEDWALSERSQLSDSENVLLDAIAEACLAVRRAWQDQESRRTELEAWRDKASGYREELQKDRETMKGADIELAVGDQDAARKARSILSGRLKIHTEVE